MPLLDDVLQDNEALREQRDKAIEELLECMETSGPLILKAIRQIDQNTRVFQKVPDECLAWAQDEMAKEDGDEILRGLHEQD